MFIMFCKPGRMYIYHTTCHVLHMSALFVSIARCPWVMLLQEAWRPLEREHLERRPLRPSVMRPLEARPEAFRDEA